MQRHSFQHSTGKIPLTWIAFTRFVFFAAMEKPLFWGGFFHFNTFNRSLWATLEAEIRQHGGSDVDNKNPTTLRPLVRFDGARGGHWQKHADPRPGGRGTKRKLAEGWLGGCEILRICFNVQCAIWCVKLKAISLSDDQEGFEDWFLMQSLLPKDIEDSRTAGEREKL